MSVKRKDDYAIKTDPFQKDVSDREMPQFININ